MSGDAAADARARPDIQSAVASTSTANVSVMVTATFDYFNNLAFLTVV